MLVHGLLLWANRNALLLSIVHGVLFLEERNIAPEICTPIEVERELLNQAVKRDLYPVRGLLV